MGKWQRFEGFPKVYHFEGFITGYKGVFRITGDCGRIFFCGLWITHWYSKFSDSLQNWRLLPLMMKCLSQWTFSCQYQYRVGGNNCEQYIIYYFAETSHIYIYICIQQHPCIISDVFSHRQPSLQIASSYLQILFPYSLCCN